MYFSRLTIWKGFQMIVLEKLTYVTVWLTGNQGQPWGTSEATAAHWRCQEAKFTLRAASRPRGSSEGTAQRADWLRENPAEIRRLHVSRQSADCRVSHSHHAAGRTFFPSTCLKGLYALIIIIIIIGCVCLQVSKDTEKQLINNRWSFVFQRKMCLFQTRLCFGASGQLTVDPPLPVFQRTVSRVLLNLGDSLLQVPV